LKLTRRQEDFVNKLLDLYREMEGPIHYSVLAERLGVSPFTAYDMLRLLEEKGLVSSEYYLPSDKSGPGRTERVFFPTSQAQDFSRKLENEVGGEDWEIIKQRILDRIRKGEIRNRELAEEMLARIPSGGEGQLRYCIEVMTVISLRLRSSSGRRVLMLYLSEVLPEQKPASRTNLCLLGGFALGLLANEDAGDYEWEHQLLNHVQSYLDVVAKLSIPECRLLGEHLTKVFAPLAETPKIQ